MRHPNRRSLAERGTVRALIAALACVLCETAAADEEPVRLDPPPVRADALSFRLTGRDPGAPRALVLWREDGPRYRRAGETRSGDDGRFSFGERPRPIGALRFVVAPLGEAPDPLHSIRIEGPLEQVSDAMADQYFHSRGRASQIASAASDQSRPLPAREDYEPAPAPASPSRQWRKGAPAIILDLARMCKSTQSRF